MPQAAEQRHEALCVAEVVGEVEVPGELAPCPARDLHVVAAEPQSVLQRHLLGLTQLLLLKNGVGDIRQAVVGAGAQAGDQTLVLGASLIG